MTPTKSADIFRQVLNLILAPAMMILSNLPFLLGEGRTPSEFSDQNDSLLVPAGIAFSIWLPIFILCISYGVYQALPKNRTHPVLRRGGWWTAAGFFFVCLWSLVSAYASQETVLWATATTFIPMVACLVIAMLIISRRKDELTKAGGYLVWLPVSLIAGWTSLAMFLNWTPIFTSLWAEFGLGPRLSEIIVLTAALIFAIIFIRKSRGNRAYVFPIVWGLLCLAAARLWLEEPNMLIGIAAIIGFFIILTVTIISGRRQDIEKI